MSNPKTREEKLDSSAAIQPEKTSMVAGPGILIKGDIVSDIDDQDNRILVAGRVEGDICTKGILQLAKGSVVAGNRLIQADTIIVSGAIVGENVTVKARLLVLQSTGKVSVSNVRVPHGGLELQRGGLLDARLSMIDEDAVEVAPLPLEKPNAQNGNHPSALLDASRVKLSHPYGSTSRAAVPANTPFASAGSA